MTALPKHRKMKQAWQHACRLILERAPVEAVTRQLSLALFRTLRSTCAAPNRAGSRSTRHQRVRRDMNSSQLEWVAIRTERVANKQRFSMCLPCDMDTTVQDGTRGQSIDLVDIPQHCGLS
jgi:hypothetical protein